jgi:K+-sensing histidine kinase KdpD
LNASVDSNAPVISGGTKGSMPHAEKSRLGYLIAPGLICIASILTYPFYRQLDFVFGAMLMLLIVLYISIEWGMGPAILASMAASLYLNYFFVAPILELNIGGGPDIVALPAFIIMSVVVGRLSQRAAQRTREAERGREEIERLYGELKVAFEKSSNLEAVKRSEQMKSALLDAVTHDLRTPLTAIKAAATTLHKGIYGTEELAPLDAEMREELIEVVVEEADRLNHFVDELLVLAKIQGGGVDTTEPPGTVEEVTTAATLRASTALRDFEVSVRLLDSATEAEVANPRIAAQALFELLENAAKYSPAATKIEVSTSADGRFATFTVDDEGPGIPEDERELIFSRFYRRANTSGSPPGLGMGLAIARGLIEAIGGKIKVTDKSERGTRFEFSVPLRSSAVQQEDSSHVKNSDQNPSRR